MSDKEPSALSGISRWITNNIPVAAISLYAIIFVIFGAMNLFLGGVSKAYMWYAKIQLPPHAIAAMDATFSILLILVPLCFTMLFALRSVEEKIESSKKDMETEVKKRICKSIDEITALARSQFCDIIELREAMRRDDRTQKICMEFSRFVVDQLSNDRDRVWREPLINRYRARLKDVAARLPNQGEFLEPTERMELSRNIFNKAMTYIVIMTECFPVKLGPAAWHESYRRFVNLTVSQAPRSVALIYFVPNPLTDEQREIAQAIRHEFCIPCFQAPYAHSINDAISQLDVHALLDYGPLFEIFDNEFQVALLSKERLGWDAEVLWKSTSFRDRETNQSLTISAAIERLKQKSPDLSSSSVWLSEDISKLVRVGCCKEGRMLAALNFICTNSSEI